MTRGRPLKVDVVETSGNPSPRSRPAGIGTSQSHALGYRERCAPVPRTRGVPSEAGLHVPNRPRRASLRAAVRASEGKPGEADPFPATVSSLFMCLWPLKLVRVRGPRKSDLQLACRHLEFLEVRAHALPSLLGGLVETGEFEELPVLEDR